MPDLWHLGGMPASLAEYRLLLAKVDAKVAEITAHQAAQLACAAGCHACCAPKLTVAAVEAAAIAEFLAADADKLAQVAALAVARRYSSVAEGKTGSASSSASSSAAAAASSEEDAVELVRAAVASRADRAKAYE